MQNISMNKLPIATRIQILNALVEGCSLRSTSRMAGVSINTVTKLLVDAGKACADYQHRTMRNLTCKRLQLDEIWAFVYAKEKNVPAEMKGQGPGSVWTWVAIDAETKLIPSYLVGDRDGEHAKLFVDDIAARINGRIQITTDGLKAYVEAIDLAFGTMVDYAVLHKVYGPGGLSETRQEARYSPATCIGCEKHVKTGNPDENHINTSFVERQNLTMRMRMRRFTRLTNAFSKKIENHEHAVALHFFHYNFVRRHLTLRMSPALKAGVTDHMWTMEEMVAMIDRHEAETKKQKNAQETDE